MKNKNEDLDQTKINRLKLIIIGKERANLKTKKNSQTKMTEDILKLIEMEVLD